MMAANRLTSWLAAVVLPLAVAGASGAENQPDDVGGLKQIRPMTRDDYDHREAKRLYGQALLHERQNEVAQAIELLHQAIRLEPEIAALHRALIALYLALDRGADALAECKKTLKLDPSDAHTWYLYAAELKNAGNLPEALNALAKSFACPALKEIPENYVQVGFDLALAYEDQKNFESALEVLDRLLQFHYEEATPTRRAELYENIARIAQKAHKWDRALDAIQKAQEAYRVEDPVKARQLLYDLATLFDRQDHPEDALRALDKYLQVQPSGTEPYEFRIRLLQKMGRGGEILPSLKQFAERDVQNQALKLLLATQYGRENQLASAERLFSELIEDAPSRDVYKGFLGLLKSQDRAADVLKLLDRTLGRTSGNNVEVSAAIRARSLLAAIEADKDLVVALLQLVGERLRGNEKLQPETRPFLAMLATRSGQVEVAEQIFRDLLVPPVNPQTEASIYDGLLRVLWNEKKYDAIVDVCRQGQKAAQATNLLLFHTHLARALVALGKTQEALVEADQAVRLADEDKRTNFQLLRVDVLRSGEKYEEAVRACQDLLKAAISPTDIRDIRYALSNVYSAANQLAKSEEQLRFILADNPNDATANNDLGYLMADQGKNLDEAEILIRKALALDAEQKKTPPVMSSDDGQPNAAYVDSLGWVLLRKGQLEDARKEMEKAVSLPDGSSDPVVWDHLGDVYFRLEELARAKEAWQKGLELYETEKRRKLDRQYRELKEKLKLLEPESHP
jgi:tetratricopeptide (TPR) repeat protein